MPDYRPNKFGYASGVPTLSEVFDSIDKNVQAQQELEMKRQQVGQAQPYAPVSMVDPKTGKTVWGMFDKRSGALTASPQEHGYAPRTDPTTGMVDWAPNVIKPPQQPEAPMQQPPGVESLLTPPQQPQSAPSPAQPAPFVPYPKLRDEVDKRRAALLTNPTYRELEAQVQATNMLKSELPSAIKNPAAAATIGTTLARMYQDGRLTDKDVEMYIPGGLPNFKNKLDAWASGTMNPETAQQILRNVHNTSQQLVKTRSSIIGNEANAIKAQFPDAPPDYLSKAFGSGVPSNAVPADIVKSAKSQQQEGMKQLLTPPEGIIESGSKSIKSGIQSLLGGKKSGIDSKLESDKNELKDLLKKEAQ